MAMIMEQGRPARRLADMVKRSSKESPSNADRQTASVRLSRSTAPAAPLSDLAALPDLETFDLRARWHEAFGIEPLTRLSREVLIAALAYHAQEQTAGGIAKTTQRRLVQLAAQLAATGTIRVDEVDAIRPGTRLVREWSGTVHEVIVLADGYLWKGRPYASLSAIARRITGARWSGPRFFGTVIKRKGRAAGKGTPQ